MGAEGKEMILFHCVETEWFGELELRIDYDYQPMEPMIIHPVDAADPGCAAAATINSAEIFIDGEWHDMLDKIPSYYKNILEEECCEQCENRSNKNED